jgi:hypothetical protein
MRMFSGPSTVEFQYSFTPGVKMSGGQGHECVDAINLSDQPRVWSGEIRIQVNLNKEHELRQSVGHIILNEDDVIALYQGLMKGLQEKQCLAEEAAQVIAKLKVNSILGVTPEELLDALAKINRLLEQACSANYLVR